MIDRIALEVFILKIVIVIVCVCVLLFNLIMFQFYDQTNEKRKWAEECFMPFRVFLLVTAKQRRTNSTLNIPMICSYLQRQPRFTRRRNKDLLEV